MSETTPERLYGDLVGELEVGPLRIQIKHSCVRRDLYDMSLGRPFPPGLREALAPLGSTRGTDALFVVEVDGRHQLTVAASTGRIVVMPKLATQRPVQRAAALELAERVIAGSIRDGVPHFPHEKKHRGHRGRSSPSSP